MKMILAVAAGGGLGAVARYLVGVGALRWFGGGFPVGTLIVNVAGSFAMGLLVGFMAQRWSASQEMRAFLAVGLLGGFTTFSSFSLEAVLLYERGALVLAALYVGLSVVAAIGGLVLGLLVMRQLAA